MIRQQVGNDSRSAVFQVGWCSLRKRFVTETCHYKQFLKQFGGFHVTACKYAVLGLTAKRSSYVYMYIFVVTKFLFDIFSNQKQIKSKYFFWPL